MKRPLKIEVISTGNELLDGTISDTNTQRLAFALKAMGLKISRATVVPDDVDAISAQLVSSSLASDVVVVSGGLGPTSDDLTLEIAAKTFGRKLIYSKKAWKVVTDRLKLFRRKPNSLQKKQAFIPEGSGVLQNTEGTAPGIEWRVGDCQFFFLPGVPREYDFLLEKYLAPWFRARAKGNTQGEHLIVVKTFGWAESMLNELMNRIRIPKEITIGYRTHLPENHIKLQIRAKSEAEARRIAAPVLKTLQRKLSSAYLTDDASKFEEIILKRLLKKKMAVAIAESCTGGLASSKLTKVSGSSKVLDRSFITYSNRSKVELLGVRSETLEKFGAVSEECVSEMARGALKRAQVDRAVAITGIAGPTGGTSKKPVGTIWIGLADRKIREVKTKCLRLGFDRELNQEYSAYQALQLLSDA